MIQKLLLKIICLLGLFIACLPAIQSFAKAQTSSAIRSEIQVGSKRFTESYILGEILSQTLEKDATLRVVRKPGLGNTGILYGALVNGDIDIYPEYLGTISQEILHASKVLTLEEVNQGLKPLGLEAGYPLGFNNSYALALRVELATQLGIKSISDLVKHPSLRLGLSHEFLARKDGWSRLREVYQLQHFQPNGLDHGLSYRALDQGQVDVIDVYTTDANLATKKYLILEDDRQYFPSYDAVLLYRADLLHHSHVAKQLEQLQNHISVTQVQQMNFAMEVESQSVERIAKAFLHQESLESTEQSFWLQLVGNDFLLLTGQHLFLVITSLGLAILIGIPLGTLVFLKQTIGQPILQIAGVIQTIPSLALLAFLIFIFKTIGAFPAIVALTMYALLPIIENTNTGLNHVSKELKESAAALGANFWKSLIYIEIPASMPYIFSGIRIAAITSTGTATIAAFVGAGGYGQRIAEGIAVSNNAVMLSGAIPAAAFAVLIQVGITLISRKFIYQSTIK